jgi:hypothetical protein
MRLTHEPYTPRGVPAQSLIRNMQVPQVFHTQAM